MKLYTSVSIVLATTVVANSQTVMLDQIGPMDGTGIGTAIIGNQDMESANDIYDLVAADNFSSGGETISTLEMVLNGWNGFVDPSSITGYTSNIFTSEANLAVSIIGDIASEYIDAANATVSPDWLGGGFLVSVNTTMVSNLGSQLIALVPSNPFATGGQTGIADSLLGDGVFAWQGNPGGGFAMPNNMQQATTDVAYRIATNSLVDPCSYLLPVPCTVDVDGDSVVSVGDVLAIIANWGECGDGTFRPAGDVSPMPSGDCCVTVGDILAVVGAWGEDCSPRGACCSQSGVCTDTLTESECLALNGSYMSDDTLCSDSQCISGACCIDTVTCNDGLGMWYCNQLGGTFRGTGSLCASVDCDLICSAIGCQPADLGGHGVDNIIGATSDTNVDAGYVSADTFSPTVSGSVSQVCWWGLYIDFSTSTDCGAVTPGTGDNFTITYYLDSADSTIPGALHAGPFAVTSSVFATGNIIPAGIGDIVQYEYTATHASVKVQAGVCYWIAISNQTTGTCFWLWETAPAGDARSSQDNSGWGAKDFDLAFCVDIDTSADGCGMFTGACCLPDVTCQIMTSVDCEVALGVYKGDGLTCADVFECQPVPGACCFVTNDCFDNVMEEDCLAFGGTYQGQYTLCADVNCEVSAYDQIGSDDGAGVGTAITASQIFTPVNELYDVATLDNFTFDVTTQVVGIEAVLNGWNGFVNLTPVSNYTISVYSSPTAAGVNLVGDVYSVDVVTPTLPPWTGVGHLISLPINVTLPAGEYFFAVIPWNEFATNGQTGIVDYTQGIVGDGNYWQANPNGGFGFGAWQLGIGDAAYRLILP